MSRPKSERKVCKICGLPAAVSYQSDGTPYNRALCHSCRNRLLRYGVISTQLFEDKNPLECERCDWVGYCDLHHKDGDHSNNELENLEFLCPNCHRSHHTPLGGIIQEVNQ